MRAIVALFAVMALGTAACTPQTPEPSATPLDSSSEVLAARGILGDPMIALAESVIALSDGLDAVRHEVERGAAMRRALVAVRADIPKVQAAAEAAGKAAEQAPVPEAAAVVERAVRAVEDVPAAAQREAAYLKGIAAVDEDLLDAAATWDTPGSQTEIRLRLAELAGEVLRIRPRVNKLRPVPDCPVMQRNRLAWVKVVHERTVKLEGQANSASGSTFDKLRTAYRRLPLGEEPRTADRTGDQLCWQKQSTVAGAAETMRAAIDQLQTTLRG